MGLKILIVDDSITARKLVIQCLKGHDCTILEAGDGKEGLLQLDSHPDINIIFSDINMPWMSGIEMVREIKSKEGLKEIPICLLTTETGEESIEEAKNLDVDAFLVKPIEKAQIDAIIEAYSSSI